MRPSTTPNSIKKDLETGEKFEPEIVEERLALPAKRHSKLIRGLRHTYFTVYRRLFSIIFIANAIAAVYMLAKHGFRSLPQGALANAASANFLAAIITRQDFFVNALYRSAWLLPRRIPLRLKRIVAKVYEHGGVHSGTAVAGTMWYIFLTVMLTLNISKENLPVPLLVMTYVLLTVLILIVVFAYPTLRFTTHNTFEIIHRLGGWTAIALLWVELILIAESFGNVQGVSIGHILVRQASFWNLVLITFFVILPWLRLRKWEFVPEKLSDHALRLHFDHNLHIFSCLAISDNPLFEWHPFATFPAPHGITGGSMVISDAGDWTHNTIQNPRTKYWVKGIPKAGVLSMGCIFERIILVTTGSGIGPSLSYLVDRPKYQECRVVWSTSAPLATFGSAINDWVKEVDPQAVIIDTRRGGRPDLVQVTYQLYVETNAEAVFVLSNPLLTRKLVYAMESRGIPAYGPIWDS
ncbi:hypothetical protein K432DRAFT_293387 [Lepidopterella palustris CBS 459.81]|uniref:Integral membrane protein TmpA n=1 Tax=Lepidopterella palustris CBS 459.81 TaxID=1314670 RepID=A0A8E2JHP6_9PEZI|nr:hypothetical protein K432DRAFT_293387 [Lepidopterella palustris CBS 459.81]